jgi:hypothetical protein
MRENGMGGAFNMHVRDEKCVYNLVAKPRGSWKNRHGSEGNRPIKWILKK